MWIISKLHQRINEYEPTECCQYLFTRKCKRVKIDSRFPPVFSVAPDAHEHVETQAGNAEKLEPDFSGSPIGDGQSIHTHLELLNDLENQENT